MSTVAPRPKWWSSAKCFSVSTSPDFSGRRPWATFRATRPGSQVLLVQAKSAAQAKGVALNALIEGIGTPAESIIAAATKAVSNLIIMGTRGKKGIVRFVLGSVASKVVA